MDRNTPRKDAIRSRMADYERETKDLSNSIELQKEVETGGIKYQKTRTTSEFILHEMNNEDLDVEAEINREDSSSRVFLYILFGFLGALFIFTVVFSILVALNKINV